MPRHPLDKYYTPAPFAQYCVNKTQELIGMKITQYLEPSAGAGAFLKYLPIFTLAYDISPDNPIVIKQDFLTLDLPYLKGRCIIGNPPYGYKGILSQKFLKKATELGDYISFILPISHLNNTHKFYTFDLIHSEKLNGIVFDGLCSTPSFCLNIYQRPDQPRSKPSHELQCVSIKDSRRFPERGRIPDPVDYRICQWGSSIGKQCQYPNQYCHEYCLTISPLFKDRVIELLKHTDYIKLFGYCGRPSLSIWRLLQYIKEQIPDIY